MTESVAQTFTDWSKIEGSSVMPGDLSWELKGRELQIVRSELDPGFTLDEHAHPEEQFVVVLAGALEMGVEGRSRVLGPGGVFYFAPNEPHAGRVVGNERAIMLTAYHPPRANFRAASRKLHGFADNDDDSEGAGP